ncbi:MAG TPA: YecA family protein [bacterium]|nr:YecA family protein [bacterium]HQG46078.1 YecA family protein [bacterium]HQI49457.1 YecA family protein [bacterium]HQJ64394.1 YecA family protein [bacterium]HQJ65506.1 YecA family protein [bacterium]
MATSPTLIKPAELERRLAALCSSTPPLAAAHGLMTAVIVGPEPLPPQRWIPFALAANGQLPEGQDQQELETLILSLFGLYNDTVADIADSRFQPWLGEAMDPETQMQNLGLWCVGFSKGMQFNEGRWFTEKDKKVAELLVPIFYFIDPGRFTPLYLKEGADEEDRFELDLIMQSQLTESVLAIHDYWHKSQASGC